MESLILATPLNRSRHDHYGQIPYNLVMKRVNISDLKAHLSAHIQMVQEGEEVIVCDRSKPVARIVPYSFEDHSQQEQLLIARGVLLPPVKKRRSASPWPDPPGNVSDEIMAQVWREERDGR